MVRGSVLSRRDTSGATGQPEGRMEVRTVGLVLHRRDALALLVTGLLLAALVLSGVAPGELGVARPTDVAGGAVPDGRCDLGSPCAPDAATEAPTRCGPNTPCLADSDAALPTADVSPRVDAQIAHALCDLNSPCAPDLLAAWHRLCDLNTPCLPGDGASGSAPGQQGVVQLGPAADTAGLAQWDTFDIERWVQARLYATEVRDNGVDTTTGGAPYTFPAVYGDDEAR